MFIQKNLEHLPTIEAADIGCGAGRYDVKLFDCFEQKLYLTCIDENKEMLKECKKKLERENIDNFKTILARATELPIPDGYLNVVLTFNAIHHLKLMEFLREVARALGDNGYLFIYTRLKSQNKRNIWGRFFPQFSNKENRLFELSKLRQSVGDLPGLEIETVKFFKYERTARLEKLITQAKAHHYSTFQFYEEKEFLEALQVFQKNITEHFEDTERLSWTDENTMLVVRNTAPRPF